MRILLIPLLALCALHPALADSERPDPFQGERAADLGEAFALLRAYNATLSEVTAGESRSTADMADIHRLSYTMENALERIEDEVEALAELLEAVHVASEGMDRDTVRRCAAEYLSGSEALLQR